MSHNSTNQELVHFTWHVHDSGYRWLQPNELEPGAKGRWLVANVPRGESIMGRQTLPLSDFPGLFLTLAELQPTESGILEFANSHGDLGFEELAPMGQGALVHGEPLHRWARAVLDMRVACDLLGAIEKKDARTLHRWIREEDGGGVRFYRKISGLGHRMARIAGVKSTTALLIKGDVVRAARILMQRIANQNLNEWTAALILIDPEEGTQGLYVVPKNLLGALWIEFAESIDSGRSKVRCIQCGSWIVVAPDTNRSDRTFCSNRCRSKAYRERQSKARLLHRKGMKPREIAKKLNSNTQTVRRWVGLSTSRRK